MPLINPGRGGFEELKVHFLMEKEQQLKESLLKDYLLLIEIPVIGLGCDATRIINAARYFHFGSSCGGSFFPCTLSRYSIRQELFLRPPPHKKNDW